ncbi:MAG: sigma 54-interacting transcriptional regulator [Bacillota bacterium]
MNRPELQKAAHILTFVSLLTGAQGFVADCGGRVLASAGGYDRTSLPPDHPARSVLGSDSVYMIPDESRSVFAVYFPVLSAGECLGVLGLETECKETGERLARAGQSIQALADMMRTGPGGSQHAFVPEGPLVQAVIEMLDEPVAVIDATGRLTHLNQAGISLFGRGAIGEWFEDRFPGSGFTAAWARLRGEGKSFVNVDLDLPEGEYRATLRAARSGPRTVGVVLTVRPDSREPGSPGWRFTFDEIKGTSPAIRKAKEMARKVASTDSTVLLLGESGTGKELFARAIHGHSFRASKPFVAINCAAIPESLLESELFGYEGGAFTGARPGGKPGKFEVANGGTVFLDEIGDMPLVLQAKLLRVLQDKEVERVGGIRPVSVDVRVISASHKDLEELVMKGAFREDLYYRLAVIPLHIPALRERKEDLYLLLEHYLRRYRTLYSKTPKRLSSEVLKVLFDYDWPGNVRELENTVEYIVNMESGDLVTLDSLPPRFARLIARETTGDPGMSIESAEADAIRRALEIYGTSARGKEKAARALGIHRATLYRKLKKLGIDA